MSSDELRRLTLALTRPDTEQAALDSLLGTAAGSVFPSVIIEALLERIHLSRRARVVLAAIDFVEPVPDPRIDQTLIAALARPHPMIRNRAARALGNRVSTSPALPPPDLARLIRVDPSWMVRRTALDAITRYLAPEDWRPLLTAADDPHWRVRHALIRVLFHRADSESTRNEILHTLDQFDDDRVRGMRLYLEWRWHTTPPSSTPAPPEPSRCCPFWDWDDAVLARHLQQMNLDERVEHLDSMPFLLTHADERVRHVAAEVLREFGERPHLEAASMYFDEPRLGIGETLQQLFIGLDPDRRDELPRQIPDEVESSPAFSPDHPIRRAAELTPETATQLIAHPEAESSWHVLARAAILARTPFWNLEPSEPWHPPATSPSSPETITLPKSSDVPTRPLGPERWPVSPIGISGHYGLPIEGFIRAWEAGVNLMFWEPNYRTMTEFLTGLSPSDRHRIYLVAGTFEATAQSIRRDAERVLRSLKRDRIDIFLLFWVREWNRIDPEVRDVLERLHDEGKIATYGLSTHNRQLAIEALESDWNPVMVRHSAAHRGAEEQIFPTATRLGVGLLAFNVTCYGRLLKPHHDHTTPPTPADCYRYTMAQPGVSACWSAPATLDQLDQNLAALREPELPEDRLRELLKHGKAVYVEDTIFRRTVRAL